MKPSVEGIYMPGKWLPKPGGCTGGCVPGGSAGEQHLVILDATRSIPCDDQ